MIHMDEITFSELLKSPWINQTFIILLYFLVAWLISIIFRQIAKRIVPLNHTAGDGQQSRLERRKTLQGLWSNAITILSFGIAILASLNIFIDLNTLIWVIGLFSAAFGLGARPLITWNVTGGGHESPSIWGEGVWAPGSHDWPPMWHVLHGQREAAASYIIYQIFLIFFFWKTKTPEK